MLTHRSCLLLGTLLLCASHPVAGENLVAFGQFDGPESIEAWTVTNRGGEGSLSFDETVDESDCAGSGSALLVTTSPGDREVEYSVCANGLRGGDDHAVGLEVYFPGGEGYGWLYWGVTWYDQADCGGNFLSETWIGPEGYVADWHALELWSTTQPETRSVLVQLWVSSLDGAVPLRLNIDNVFVKPQAELFADAFELGELCRWGTN